VRARWNEVLGRLCKAIRNVLIEGYSEAFCLDIQPPVKSRVEPNHELSRKGPVRFFSTVGAKLEIIVDGVTKGLLEFLDGCALKGDHITSIENLAME
jgi:hypothetical protein